MPSGDHLIDKTSAEKGIKANINIIEILAKSMKIDRRKVETRKPTIANWDAQF